MDQKKRWSHGCSGIISLANARPPPCRAAGAHGPRTAQGRWRAKQCQECMRIDSRQPYRGPDAYWSFMAQRASLPIFAGPREMKSPLRQAWFAPYQPPSDVGVVLACHHFQGRGAGRRNPWPGREATWRDECDIDVAMGLCMSREAPTTPSFASPTPADRHAQLYRLRIH